MVLDRLRDKLGLKNELARALLGEFTGTLLLLLVGNSVVASAVVKVNGHALNTHININVGFGLAIAFGVAITAKLSGGHINPAVSLMFLTFKQLSVVRFLLYALVQTAGAFVGAALSYLFYRELINQYNPRGDVGGAFDTAGIFASYRNKGVSLTGGFIDQVIATATFCFLIAHLTDKRNAYPSWSVPFLVGTSFVMIGTAFSFNTGYPVNPARDFGPRLFTFLVYGSAVFRDGWWIIPIVGPLIGAVLGGWFYEFAIGFHTPADEDPHKYVVVSSTELKPLTAKESETA